MKKETIDFARSLRQRQTQAEKLLWQYVRNRRLGNFKIVRQQPFVYEVDSNGFEKTFIVDFYCAEAKLVIELDGKIHEYQQEYDKQRAQILESKSLQVIRFTNEYVINNWEDVLQQLLTILKNRILLM